MEVSEEVIQKIERWVDSHPSPDEPLLVIGKNSYSPRQILEEARRGNESLRKFYRNINDAFES